MVSPGIAAADLDPAQYVARVDNQWAIIQSVFLVDPGARSFRAGRTWGQAVTGKYQDVIVDVLEAHYAAGRGPSTTRAPLPPHGSQG